MKHEIRFDMKKVRGLSTSGSKLFVEKVAK